LDRDLSGAVSVLSGAATATPQSLEFVSFVKKWRKECGTGRRRCTQIILVLRLSE
jgi:hypothetical protein